MTHEQAKSIFSVLKRLETYRIFWRIGPTLHLPGIDLNSLPPHINVTTFMPQNDLLGMFQFPV